MSQTQTTDESLAAICSIFTSVCNELGVERRTIIRKAVLFFDGLGDPSEEANALRDDANLIKCIDSSGKTTKIPQASLYLPLKAVSKL